MDEKLEGVERIECSENPWLQHDAAQAQDADNDEPRQHDGTEYLADEAGPTALNNEQSDQNCQRDRKNDRSQCGRIQLQTFNCAQNGDCRRDGAIAIEKRRAHQSKNED